MLGTAKIGQTIARLRRNKGITQEQLAISIGSTQPHLSNIENGNVEPTISMIYRICDALGINITEFSKEAEWRKKK